MAPMLLRGLKGVNISCTSPSSTAICSTIDHQPPVHRHHGRRSLDRSKLPSSTLSSPFSPSSKPSRSPKQKNPAYLLPASPASSSRYLLNGDFDSSSSSSSSSSPVFGDPVDPVRALVSIDPWRFRSVSGEETLVDLKPSIQSRPKEHVYFRSVSASSSSLAGASNNSATWVRFHTVDRGDDSAVLKRLPSARVDSHEQIGFPTGPSPSSSSSSHQGLAAARLRVAAKGDETSVLKSSTSARTRDQVVVLRVSLHCKGCEGKVRKHISRMPGVTSFSIDFATKKVTVIGDVTPLGVLSSISKVKNAQLWPSPSPSPPQPPPAPSGLSSTS